MASSSSQRQSVAKSEGKCSGRFWRGGAKRAYCGTLEIRINFRAIRAKRVTPPENGGEDDDDVQTAPHHRSTSRCVPVFISLPFLARAAAQNVNETTDKCPWEFVAAKQERRNLNPSLQEIHSQTSSMETDNNENPENEGSTNWEDEDECRVCRGPAEEG